MHGRYADYYEPGKMIGPYTNNDGYTYWYNKTRKSVIYVGTDGYVGKCDESQRYGFNIAGGWMKAQRFAREVQREAYLKALSTNVEYKSPTTTLVPYKGADLVLAAVRTLATDGYYKGTFGEIGSVASLSSQTIRKYLKELELADVLTFKTTPGSGIEIVLND